MRIPHSRLTLRTLLARGAAAAALLTAGQALALPVPVSGPYAVAGGGGGQPVITSGSTSVNVDLNAARTIIDWQNFNLNAGETANFAFDARGQFVLNRVNSQAININGAINGTAAGALGGNVLFYSPQGVAFGPNTRVNVAGLLATSAAMNTTAFLSPTGNSFPFTGSGTGGPVTVASGAQINATRFAAFVAPMVTTAAGSTVTVGDGGSTLYGGADSYEVQLFPTGDNDFTIFTFIVPNAAAGTPHPNALNIAGDTTSGTIYLAAYSRAQLASTLINAPGLLTARSSIVQYGQVTITTGRTILLGQVGIGAETQQVAGVTTGSVNIGTLNADGNVNIWLTGTGSLGNLNATGSIRAGQNLSIAAQDVTVAGGLIGGDTTAGVAAARRNLFIDMAGVLTTPSITSGNELVIVRGPAQTGRTTSEITFRLGNVNSAGRLLFSSGASIDAGNIVSGGEAQLFGSLPVRLTSLTTNGYTRISSSQTINVTGAVRGVDIDLRSAGGITAASLVGSTSVMVGTGGVADIGSITGPSLLLDGSTARLGTVTISGDARIRTNNLDLLTSLTAANLTVEQQNGVFRLGGTDSSGLSDAEFQRIRVTGQVNLFGGVQAATVNVPTPVYGDFTLGNLTIDPTRVPKLALNVRETNTLFVSGVVRPSAPGVTLQVGSATATDPWTPDHIYITGSLGTASGDALAGFTDVHDFRLVQLYAKNDILIGSQRFIDLVDPVPPEQIDIGRGLPIGVAATTDELGKLFIVTGKLQATANGRIVQQNTGPPGFEAGLYLTGEGLQPTDVVLEVGKAQIADLFGAVADASGATGGQQLSFSARIGRPDGDTTTGRIRINGCQLGVGCFLPTPATQFRVESFRPAAVRAAVDPPVLTPPPPVDEDEREAEAVITGTGNEEIWRNRK